MAKREKKDQYVVAHIADLNRAGDLLRSAQSMAVALGKGLVALYVVDPSLCSASADEAELALKRMGCRYVVLKGNTRQVVADLPALVGAVLMVVAVDPTAHRRSGLNPRTVLRNYADCKTAYLTLQFPIPVDFHPARVALSVDFRRESKEKLLWASYMARFVGSTVEVCYRDYSDEGLKQKWYNNMLFLNKFFANLGLTFTPFIVSGRGARVDIDLLDQHRPDMLISITTDVRERDVVDAITGTQESRVVKNRQHIPVMFLNPRDDLYVLCD